MSATTDIEDLNLRQALAEIDRTQAETRKLLAEHLKMTRERAMLPWQVAVSGMAAGGALVGGTVALMKVLGAP